MGQIWALTLWEVRSRIIADPAGANGDVPTGNHTMLQLTTDALKMTPLNPSVVDARDALIDADCAANAACPNERSIWAGFADRGLGYKAVAPLGQSGILGRGGHMGVGESFSSPYLDVAKVAVDDSVGNNNGAIDPGEPIGLSVTLTNPWRGAAQGVLTATATLSSATPGVTILDNASTYGAIPAQGNATGDRFLFTLSPSATCGQSLKFTIQTTSVLGTFSTDFTLRVGTAAGTGAPVTYTHTIAGGLSIPDNSPPGVADSLTIPDDSEIADLDFRVDDLTHTWIGDVTVMLKAPNGYGTDLIYRRDAFRNAANAGDGDNFVNTRIDGQATADLNQALPAGAPFTGSWLPAFNSPIWNLFGIPNLGPDPVDQLGRLNGLSSKGTWKVLVADQFQFDTGKLNAWSLIVTPRAFTCAPFTATASVSGVKSVVGNFVEGGAITYTVTLTNSGAATQPDNPGNEFTDVLPAQLTLVSTSATTGTAVATIGTNTVTWNGPIPPLGGAVTVTIHATIKPGSAGATIAIQGTIAFDADNNGTNEASALTDNPATGTPNDPTTFVVAAPAITATNVDTLAVDNNGDGEANPGDTIKYTIMITNSGSASATGVAFASGALDPNTSLVVGSVTTTQGTVTSGNSVGNTTVGVTIGAIAASGSVTLTFRVTVANPLPAGVTQVSNQGTFTGGNFTPALTDDPSTGAVRDPTITPVTSRRYIYLSVVIK